LHHLYVYRTRPLKQTSEKHDTPTKAMPLLHHT